MKKFKSILMIFMTAALSFIAVFASGCLASAVNSFIGNWQLDFIQTDEDAGLYFKNVYLTVSKTSAEFSVEFTDEFINNNYSCNVKTGKYNITSIRASGNRGLELNLSDGLYGGTSENVLWINNCIISSDKESYISGFDLKFEKTDESHSGNGGNNGGNISPDSKFEAIKTAYKNAGYTVDLGQDDLDPSMAAAVRSLQEAYAALGYGICVIGKNIDNMLGAEMYMLIGTLSPEEAQELADTYKDAYKYAVKGSDIIISIWPIGTPNFAPFNNAT